MWESPNLAAVMQGEAGMQRLGRAAMIEHLAGCIHSDGHPIVSGEHALHVLEIMLKAIQSAREGRALELDTSFPTGD